MLWGTQGSHLPVPQSVPHLICVPQVPQMWHKMWHNSIYILSTNQYMSMKIRWTTSCDVIRAGIQVNRSVRGRRRCNLNFWSKIPPIFVRQANFSPF